MSTSHLRFWSTSCARTGLLLLLSFGLVACTDDATPRPDSGRTGGWDAYGGDAGGQRHSPVDQITPANVDDLEVAWVYNHGDVITGGGYEAAAHGGNPASTTFQNTPILLDGTLYICSPFNKVIALDAQTGEEKWKFDPEVDLAGAYLLNCRGVSAWTDSRAREGAFCATRIFTGTIDARLIALDAETGKPCPDFGESGAVDLTEGIGDIQSGEYGVTSPPVVLGDRVITGSMVLDNRRADAPSGVVRAYSARSGRRLWAWNALVPGAETTETGEFRRGTSNAWTALSADPERNLVFVPTGNTSPDYFGGHREGLDYYSSSVIALDGDSGEVVWNYQTVHHDIWDYDIGAQPVLFDFPTEQGSVPGVIAATKMGHLFFLDRLTGEPLLPVEERRVPGMGCRSQRKPPTITSRATPPIPQILLQVQAPSLGPSFSKLDFDLDWDYA